MEVLRRSPDDLKSVGKEFETFELEIIACSLEDALAAFEGGATRLEVTVSLEHAGLTPPLALVQQIVQRAPIPARIMLRERPDFVLSGMDELRTLRQRAREFATAGVEGFVVGHVKGESLDLDALEAIIQATRSMPVTVHNAIEQTADPLNALRALRTFPTVDRALVRAGRTVQERIQRLPDYERAIGPGKELILGGDLQLDMLQPLQHDSKVRIFHLGRAVRTPETHSGRVDTEKVRSAVRLLSRKYETNRERTIE
ncbi:MAG: copper homeostasis protein CutC [Terriglobia bacterium]